MIRYLLLLVTIALSVPSYATCIQDENLYREYRHEQHREETYNSNTIVKGEISTEHLQRYWGMTGQPLASVPTLHYESLDESCSNSNNNQVPQQHAQIPNSPTSQMGDSKRYFQSPEGTLSANTPNSRKFESVFSSSASETLIIDQLKLYISNSDTYSNWLRTVTDSELLRFVRARKGDINAAWQMMWDHSIWRQSSLGPDSFSPADHYAFEISLLNEELFWSGIAYDGSPVLYFKSGVHQSGTTDAQFYTRFVVWLLEKGKREFGVGLSQQLYVIVDRTPSLQNKEHSFGSPSAASNLSVMKAIFTAVQDNYPEVLKKAFIVPANTITRMLFLGASALMDERSRQKFVLIKSDEINWWTNYFPQNVLQDSLSGLNQGNREQDKEVYQQSQSSDVYIDSYGYQRQY